jgi:hypothetical protein
VRNHIRFEKLFKFTLASGVAEIENHRRLKEEKQQSSASTDLNDDSTEQQLHETDHRSSSSSSLSQMYTLQKFTPTEEWVRSITVARP